MQIRVNWVHSTKIRSYGLETVTWVHRDKIHHMVRKESFGYTMEKSGHMVLKGVNWVQNDKIRSNGLESSQLGSES